MSPTLPPSSSIIPFHHSLLSNRRSSSLVARSVAVLGGGLAGLTTAYYLSRRLPSSTKIILIEKDLRFGGWVASFDPARNRPLAGHSAQPSCVFEGGPRSVRPNGLAGLITLELLRHLGLSNSLIIIPKTHPSAKNRYIYTRKGLQKLPSSIIDFMTSIHKRPINLLPSGILQDLIRRDRVEMEDESVKDFIRRRFGQQIGEDLVSGMVHGIYAGDYGQLSARSSLFGPIWELERRHGGVLKGLWKNEARLDERAQQIAQQLPAELTGASVWGLRGGLESLTVRLRTWLEEQSNVVLKSGQAVRSIDKDSKGLYQVTTSAQTYGQLDHLVSALPPQVLHACLPLSLKESLQSLTYNPSVTVAVVNLAYCATHRINPIPPAFGYLIPAGVGLDLNPHRVLGVVFDSDMMPGVDQEAGQGKGGLTKLTVMLGGHYYSNPNCPVPTPERLVEQARETLQRQLGINQNPIYTMAHVQRDCIPQYLVGHHQRMMQLHGALKLHNLSLVGSGYGGVGVNDVVKSSHDVAENIVKNGTATGLERFELL